MSTFVAHAVTAYALTRVHPDALARRRPVVLAAMACAMGPDLDVIAFAFGIPYEHVLGHRGLTHSLVFAALLALVPAGSLLRREALGWLRRTGLFLLLFLATASHGAIDALTDGGLGIAFFAPFDTARYFLPWQPLTVPPIGIRPMFSDWGLAVVTSELLYVGIPSIVLIAAAATRRRMPRQ